MQRVAKHILRLSTNLNIEYGIYADNAMVKYNFQTRYRNIENLAGFNLLNKCNQRLLPNKYHIFEMWKVYRQQYKLPSKQELVILLLIEINSGKKQSFYIKNKIAGTRKTIFSSAVSINLLSC